MPQRAEGQDAGANQMSGVADRRPVGALHQLLHALARDRCEYHLAPETWARPLAIACFDPLAGQAVVEREQLSCHHYPPWRGQHQPAFRDLVV